MPFEVSVFFRSLFLDLEWCGGAQEGRFGIGGEEERERGCVEAEDLRRWKKVSGPSYVLNLIWRK